MFHRTRDHPEGYTVLDNGFLRNRSLSLKARGLLATILSLRNDWDFKLRGFEAILPDGRTAIASAVKELEEGGYIDRLPQGRGPDGCMLRGEWDVFERPHCSRPMVCEPPAVENQRDEHAGSAFGEGQERIRSIPVTGFPYTVNKPN